MSITFIVLNDGIPEGAETPQPVGFNLEHVEWLVVNREARTIEIQFRGGRERAIRFESVNALAEAEDSIKRRV